MSHRSKSAGAMFLRLIVGLALMGWPGVGAAQGTWSVISLPQKPGEVYYPYALAVGAAGILYVADDGRIQQRDAQGNWSVITPWDWGLGPVWVPTALAVDAAGNLYVADRFDGSPDYSRIQKRDARGNWFVVAINGTALGQVRNPWDLAVDAAGNLYVVDGDYPKYRIQKRDTQGNWSVIATRGTALVIDLAVDAAGNLYVTGYDGSGQSLIEKRDVQGSWSGIATSGFAIGQFHFYYRAGLAVDSAGNLYVADAYGNDARVQKRDAQGNWSVIATHGTDLGQIRPAARGLAVDGAGNLYVADSGDNLGRIQKRDAQSNWSVIATDGWEPGQVGYVYGLAVDAAGNLYVAEEMNFPRIQRRDAQGHWSVLATYDRYSPLSLAADRGGNLYGYVSWPSYYDGLIEKRDVQGHWSVLATVAPLKYVDYIGDLHYSARPVYLAADAGGNLYVAAAQDWDGDYFSGVVIQKRDTQGHWSVIDYGSDYAPTGLATDRAGNLYVANGSSIDKRDAQGNWSVIATSGADALAVDAAGSLYVANGQIQKRDAQGHWSVIATPGTALGQVSNPSGLAVDGAGSLYVADTGNNRVLKYTPAP